MRIQLLSDLHLETEAFAPEPNPAAELLVLGGDIDSSWEALERFCAWPVPVLMVAGNHEFDGRDVDEAWPALRARCDELGITLLERESLVLVDAEGARVRFVATVRWCDFDLFGEPGRATAMRAAGYYMRIMRSTRRGVAFDPQGVREEALACRAWLADELVQTGDWDRTVVLTHFAPSLRSADPRYGAQPGTASFCNADDALLPHASTWIHGHLHCRHDYLAEHALGRTRVVCNARGHARKGEAEGHDPLRIYDV
jgi:DNA repair exonuclease SbcCD nuclease subunit